MTINYMCTWFHLPGSSKQIQCSCERQKSSGRNLKQRYRVMVRVYMIRNITVKWLSVGKNIKSLTLEIMTENFLIRKQTTIQTKQLNIYNFK